MKAKENATITVTYKGRTETFELQGAEVSSTDMGRGKTHRYMGTASKDHIGSEVERIMIKFVRDEEEEK